MEPARGPLWLGDLASCLISQDGEGRPCRVLVTWEVMSVRCLQRSFVEPGAPTAGVGAGRCREPGWGPGPGEPAFWGRDTCEVGTAATVRRGLCTWRRELLRAGGCCCFTARAFTLT